MMTFELAELTRILRDEWDPIGVGEVPEAAEQYDDYAPPLLDMMKAGASEPTLANYLVAVERDKLGLNGDPARAARVARIALQAVFEPQ